MCWHSRWHTVRNAVGAGVGGGALVFGGVGPFIIRVGAGVVYGAGGGVGGSLVGIGVGVIGLFIIVLGRAVHLFAGSSWYLSALVVGVLLPFIFHIHLHRGWWWDRFVLAAFVLVVFVLLSSLTAQLSCRTS